jgi:hypothetical protein
VSGGYFTLRALASWCLGVSLFFFAAPAFACADFTKAPSTRWQVVKEHGVAWLVTPCGDKFFSLGVNVIDGGAQGEHLGRDHYDWRGLAPSVEDWGAKIAARLEGWGFNTAGGWSLPPSQLPMPAMIDLSLGHQADFHWSDPFDPAAEARVAKLAAELTAPYRDTPYRIGYFSDNETGWWSGALFWFYARDPADNHTKQRWLAMLRETYGDDWRKFAADFVPPDGVASWDALLRSTAITRLRVGGNGIKAVRKWTAIVAGHYYKTIADALKRADPNALYLGDRLPIYYDADAVRAAAPYVDVLSVNYNVNSPEGWIAPYFFEGLRSLTGGKPVLVSEWFFAARENRTGNTNNGHLMTVDTQAQRASGAAAAAAMFAAVPELVGLHWFQLYDEPHGGRVDDEDFDFGLVDARDRPYRALVDALTTIDRAIPRIHADAIVEPDPPRAVLTIPKAAVDFAHRSFIDWPKASAQLPPLKPAPGEVAFGQAMLSWSEQGLALATIGQDFYDVDGPLLAYDGAFPLSEAYRVELDVDAGAGPKRFTLYFIPPTDKLKTHVPTTPKLCQGAASEHRGGDCAAVPGAETLYFGADQPRIVGAMRLPWSALGLNGPPADGKLKIEVSSTAWFRSRWMSLSGAPPARGAADPSLWRDAVLTDPAKPG